MGKNLDFDNIFQEYEKPIYNFIKKHISKNHEAEDLTQMVFIKLYKNLDKYKNNGKFKSWLYTIAKRTTIDWIRSYSRKEEKLIIDDPKIFFEPRSPNNLHDDIRKKIDIEKAFNKLTPKERKIIKLRFWHGYSYKKISRELNVPLNTVKTQLFRGKSKLKSQIQHYQNETF